MKRPRIGDIVHYVSSRLLPNWNSEDDVLAAIIVALNGDGTVDLEAFVTCYDHGLTTKRVTCVKYGNERYRWRWPVDTDIWMQLHGCTAKLPGGFACARARGHEGTCRP